jgi:enhancing lycopene biosynthesis protein 2
MKIGILLSGCGVYDGAEIQESVLTMLAIQEIGAEYLCIGINENQHHVVNHLTGAEMSETRNMMVEAARIARGEIIDIHKLDVSEMDALVIPGGFGSAKNLTTWAFDGPNGEILDSVRNLLIALVQSGKPIVALCVSPVVLAKAFEGSDVHTEMTIGSSSDGSPYNISDFANGLTKTGVKTSEKTIREILIDRKNKIITAPCYMMDASLLEIRNNIHQAITAIQGLIV